MNPPIRFATNGIRPRRFVVPTLPSLASRISATTASAPVRLADLASQRRAAGQTVYDFSAGRADEATPAYINAAAIEAMNQGHTHQTMAQGTPAYRAACAHKLARDNGIIADPDRNVIATMGCKQGLLLSLLATLEPGDEVIVEDPCFVSYQPEIHVAGGVAVAVPLRAENKFRWDPAELAAAITPRTKAILFCSPHNPTGVVHTRADLQVIADLAQKHNLVVISDEIYEAVAWGGRKPISITTLPGMAERTFTLMGTTKGFAMGGWRIGFVHADERFIRAMVVLTQHLQTSASSITQAGATVAFGQAPGPELLAMRQAWEERCTWVTARLDAVPGIHCAMPEGGFYAWIDVRERRQTSLETAEALLRDHGVVVVPGSAFGAHGEGWLRMTGVKSWDVLRAGTAILEKALD